MPNERRPPRRTCAGFTLIEMLLALALTAAVFAAIAGALSLGGQAMRAGERKIDDAESLLLTYRVLRQAVSRSYGLPAGDDPDAGIRFEGRTDHLRLVAFLPPYPQASGAYEIEFEIGTNGAGASELWVRRRPYRPDLDPDTAEPDADRFLVYRGKRGMAFSYYGPGKGGASQLEWQDTWQDRPILPRLIRLSFEDQDSGPGRWPAVTLRPRSSPAAICVQLPTLPLCQQEQQP